MQTSKKNKTDATINANYVWDHMPMYSTRPEIKVTSRSYDSSHCQRAACSLENAAIFLYSDKPGGDKSELMSHVKGKLNICLTKIGKRCYLSDNGETFSALKKQSGMSKSGFIRLLRRIDTDYDLSVLNEELCVEISDPTYLTDCYRNLVSVILRIQCLTQYA